MKTFLVKYDDSYWSKFKYYAKRFSKNAISLIVAGVISYALNDPRFVALIPFLEIMQKIAKDKGFWY